MKVKINKNNTSSTYQPSFKGPLDGTITQTLINIDTNPMVNAALVDIFSMVIPRTYVDTKKRNKYAGTETLFRELTGTFIVCLSSGIIAKGLSYIYNKTVNPEIKINPNSWVVNDGIGLLKHSWDKSGNKTLKYIDNILSNLSGTEGRSSSEWKNIDWPNVEWFDDSKWAKFSWKDSAFNNIQNNLKDKDKIIETLTGVIENKNIDKKDAKQVLQIIEHRITNALKITNSVSVKLDDKTFSTSLHNLIRDTYDLGKNVFTNSINVESALNKLQKMNKVKTLGALAIASGLGLTNQYINRQITKKRTGSDAFVGDVDYNKNINLLPTTHLLQGTKVADIGQNIYPLMQETRATGIGQNIYPLLQGVGVVTDKPKENKDKLWVSKILASAGIMALAAFVMKIKNPKDFIKKLEFSSAITSGNAIKTVYTATLVGRFLAAKTNTELRESVTRDYLAFLNWLVFGGFAAKGVANLLDRGQNNLFNIHKKGKGLKHWLNDISLKSHAEIASKGTEFAKKNIWKLNIAHISGLAYSTVALGILIPLLNISVTKHNHNKSK